MHATRASSFRGVKGICNKRRDDEDEEERNVETDYSSDNFLLRLEGDSLFKKVVIPSEFYWKFLFSRQHCDARLNINIWLASNGAGESELSFIVSSR